jgi:DNA-binding HxlR family transcriptional regulator
MTEAGYKPWVLDDDLNECPVAETLRSIGGKHTPKILNCLAIGDHHFLELSRVFPDVSRKVLTERLRELEDIGLVSRMELKDARNRVRYGLTAKGKSLADILGQIYAWALEHREPETAAARLTAGE